MTSDEIKNLTKCQRDFFNTGITLDIIYRKIALYKLKNCITRYENKIAEALKKDLGKSHSESYMCEIGLTLSEITYMLKHINKFAREKTVPTPITNFHARSYKKPSPHGVVLIMSPWNYPFLLTMEPLVDAIAAGNTCILKPSAYSPHTSQVIEEIINECFDAEYVTVVTGGRTENAALLNKHFDYIFFTGSQEVGKIVMESAAKHLTPVTLELGGKSPCIIDKSANLKLAAKRIVFGKYLNCGQTCVAPDYILCHEEVKEEFVKEVIHQIKKQYGKDPLNNKNYGKIINEKHFKRINKLINPSKVIYGGKSDAKSLKIEPTVMDNVKFSDTVMKEEIFGPIMPIITYQSINNVIKKINSLSHPLALYIFTEDKSIANKVLSKCSFGGGCVNDTIMHLATSEMGFGGFGESGMGSYHGKDGFDTFSHYKSIMDKKTYIDLPMRYQPYNKIMDLMVKMFLK